MTIKLKKPLPLLLTGFGIIGLLTACETTPRPKETADCSSVFESRTVDGQKIAAKKAKKQTYNSEEEKAAALFAEEAQVPKVCKVLEIKIDNNTKCEIVGSDKIDSLSKILSENKRNKIILITPEDKMHDVKKVAKHYLAATGIDVEKYVDSDLFKNMKFNYKGIRCNVAGKEFVAWSGDKRLIVTFGK
jgi:hypothetical protein